MLHSNNRQTINYAPAEADPPLELIDFLRGILRQQLAVILSTMVVAIVLGLIYVFVAPPTFTARATMIIDKGKVQAQLGGMSRELPVDMVDVESQIQLIKSETVALAVVKKLNLDKDPEFIGPWTGLAGWFHELRSHLFSSDLPDFESDPARVALAGVTRGLKVNRVGGYIIEIEFRSLKPETASEIANAFADCYLEDQLNSRYLAARQAGSWLQGRIQELGEQSALADEKVVQFKAKNKIVAAGGRLINDQQLSELNTQLGLAREKTAETRARLDRIDAIVRDASPDKRVAATVADTLVNPVIVKLRSQYLELTNREADWSRRFGKDHLAVINLGRQIREIRGSIADELRQIAETYRSDHEIAKQRQAEIEKTIESAVSQSQESSQAQIELRQLESSAETYRGLYKSALQRNTELVQQQSFPGTEARLIARAPTPTEKSGPKKLLILLGSAAGGVMLGLGFGILRSSLDRTFRTSAQVEAALQSQCLTLAPVLKPLKPNAPLPRSGVRTIMRTTSVIWEVVDRPFSRFAEALRSIKSAADLSGPKKSIKVLGFTSSLPNEGKSTIASSFALLAARTGARTILVDCDLRNPALSPLLAPKAEHGILDVISGKQSLEEVLWSEPTTNLAFLPGPIKSRLAHSSEILASHALRTFFAELREKYDYVIVDLPPIAPIVDVRSTGGLVDSYVFIVEWGRTKIEVAELALGNATVVHDNLLGVVLNKVDFKVMSRHEGHRSDYYSENSYARYGGDSPSDTPKFG